MSEQTTVKETLGETLARHILKRIEKLEAVAGLETPTKMCGHCLCVLTEGQREHWRLCVRHPLRSLPFVAKFLETNAQGYDQSSDLAEVMSAIGQQVRADHIVLKKAHLILGLEDNSDGSSFLAALNALVEKEPEKEN